MSGLATGLAIIIMGSWIGIGGVRHSEVMMKQRVVEDVRQILESMAELHQADGLSLEERVHTFRKSGKRVRALLELFESGKRSSIHAFRGEVAAIARTLSVIRDRHVAVRTAGSLQTLDGVPIAEHPARKMIDALIASESAAIACESSEVEHLFHDACERIACMRKEWPKISARAEARSPKEGLESSYRQGRKATERVLLGCSDSEPFHELRKTTKRLGYQADWTREALSWELGGWDLGSTRTGCKELGDRLGEGLDWTRLAERFEVWIKGGSAEADKSIVTCLFRDGMLKLESTLALACRLYFRTGREFRRELDEQA